MSLVITIMGCLGMKSAVNCKYHSVEVSARIQTTIWLLFLRCYNKMTAVSLLKIFCRLIMYIGGDDNESEQRGY